MMKRLLSIVLIVLLCCPLFACSTFGTGIKDPATFYYPRSIVTYGVENSVIASEYREAAGHANDPHYLISLYLRGPMDDGLVSPFPTGTSLIGFYQEDRVVYLTLSDAFASLSGLDLSVACACLCKTCFDLCDADRVEIRAESALLGKTQTITMTRDSILLHDNSAESVSASNPTELED